MDIGDGRLAGAPPGKQNALFRWHHGKCTNGTEHSGTSRIGKQDLAPSWNSKPHKSGCTDRTDTSQGTVPLNMRLTWLNQLFFSANMCQGTNIVLHDCVKLDR